MPFLSSLTACFLGVRGLSLNPYVSADAIRSVEEYFLSEEGFNNGDCLRDRLLMNLQRSSRRLFSRAQFCTPRAKKKEKRVATYKHDWR